MNYALDVSVVSQGDLANTGQGGDGVSAPTLEQLTELLLWLDTFHQDRNRSFAMDGAYRLWQHYETAARGDAYVLRILTEKLSQGAVWTASLVNHDAGNVVVVPNAFQDLDTPLRLVLSLTLADRSGTSIVNAIETAWPRAQAALEHQAVNVVHLVEDWVTTFIAREDEVPFQPQAHQPHIPPDSLEGDLANAVCRGAGRNGRKAWENAGRRYEFDHQHGRLEVFSLSSHQWLHEARLDGTTIKTTGGNGRRWGKR